MRRARRWTSVLLVVMATAMAFALEVPADAEVLVTDAGSRIVGVGRVVAGASFELVLVEGFAGPAVVVWLTPDGGVRTTAVVVVDGAVWVDDAELTSLLPEAFVAVRVRFAKELGDAWPPDVGQGPSADVPRGGPAEGRGPPAAADPSGPPNDGASGQPNDGQPNDGQPNDGPSGQPNDGQPNDGPSGQPNDGQPNDGPSGQPNDGQPNDGPPDADPPGAPAGDPPGPPASPPGGRS